MYNVHDMQTRHNAEPLNRGGKDVLLVHAKKKMTSSLFFFCDATRGAAFVAKAMLFFVQGS